MPTTYGVLPQWLQEKVDAIKQALKERPRVLFDWVWGEPVSEFATWLMHVQRNGLYRTLSVERIVSIYRWALRRIADEEIDPIYLPLPMALRLWWDQEFVDADGDADHNPPGWRGGRELSVAAIASGVEDGITRWTRLCDVANQHGFAPPLYPATLGVIDPDTQHRSYRDWFDFPQNMASVTLAEALEKEKIVPSVYEQVQRILRG
jgi:hypothetical protein